ncbi:MAG: flavodoxin family protein [Haloarculaceae archaeon]
MSHSPGSERSDPSDPTSSADLSGEPVVVYYSRTGTTERVASAVADALGPARVESIRPRTERPYWNWLLRSFVPGSTVPIAPVPTDLRNASAVFLGSPKWTLSCPPVTEFLDEARLDGVPTGVFLTYGGFDEKRYADALVDRVEDCGADVRATLLVERDSVDGSEYRAEVDEFCQAVLDA